MPDRYATYAELSNVSAAVQKLASEQAETRKAIAHIEADMERTADSLAKIEANHVRFTKWIEGSTDDDGTRIQGLLEKLDTIEKQRLWLRSGVLTIAVSTVGTVAVAIVRLIVDVFGPPLLAIHK